MTLSKSNSAPGAFNSKVGSCSGLMSVAGNMVALPHGRRSGSATPGAHFNAVTESSRHYKMIPQCYASMDRKPLSLYQPNCQRSQLAQEDAPVPMKNASTLRLENKMTVHKRRFITTSQAYYTGLSRETRTNPAMIADSTKLIRRLREQ
eukprot:TRINITY_DN27946_c0_g1_i1.p1 TRINITY_DN27946_c0_g1~~TRINITY_DN27946_c0_g1_i1.p1  ORF type:complete len:149 (-),score=15.21 TRINITY_DN27946_c0_g1_i1:136-582(-)